MKTEYLQGDDAKSFIANCYCECCLRPAKIWAEEDKFGNVEVYADEDSRGNLVGFLCPECAARKMCVGDLRHKLSQYGVVISLDDEKPLKEGYPGLF